MSSRTPARGTTPTPTATAAPPRRARHGLAIAAAVIALVSVAALLAVLLTTMVGARPWAGLVGIAMIGMPLAFLAAVGLVIDAIRGRRSTAGRRGRP
ncbi:hypothetical protein GCM10011512_15700 [Tersicoccus solisilvae]|uniref:Uncharacterized protein n=1 Tax=Tersicoccus solisilvae TaxID=1882339 RepID=A0ABQ1P9U5_9MICC|nr:hypothetical protein [Tersicoccus solisilvae]GGC89606.1 hypothetical protein GCM10011512_15700 [Tersicoccus solisilvae]